MPLSFSAAFWPAEEEVPREASPQAAGPGDSLRAWLLPPVYGQRLGEKGDADAADFSHLVPLPGGGRRTMPSGRAGRLLLRGRPGFGDTV